MLGVCIYGMFMYVLLLPTGLFFAYSFGKKVAHYQIQRNEKSWVTVDGVKWFENLVKLIEVCQF